jgi:hypothetical protein
VVRESGRLDVVRMLRDFEPAERVAARLEISTGRLLGGRCSGLDVMGDGSMVPFSGAVMRRPIEPGEGETPFDAIRRELGG